MKKKMRKFHLLPQKALFLDVYRNLGIYHLDQKEYDEALNLFKKAKELDDTTHMIDELIRKAERQG